MNNITEDKKLQLNKNKRRIGTLEQKLNFRKAFETTVIGAFAFVAGLFWRYVANALVDVFLPQ
jgi:hypothetical protein